MALLKFDEDSADEILHFWFERLNPQSWFATDDKIDAIITCEFQSIWEMMRNHSAEIFITSARTALAAIILFDQFPRNMFRGQAQSFATDALALRISAISIELGYDDKLLDKECAFLYMPFMHSENIEDQNKSVSLFQVKGLIDESDFAIKHRDAIREFGRFPHRNSILNRESTPEEKQAIADGLHW